MKQDKATYEASFWIPPQPGIHSSQKRRDMTVQVFRFHYTLVLLALCWISPVLSSAHEPASKPVDFAREVLPILSNKCFVCHGPDGEAKEEVRLDSYASATRDLGDRRAIDPKALAQSQILVRIHDKESPMPPPEAEKQLTSKERDILSRWVLQGGEYALHWAFVPPQKSPLPAKPQASNAIDAFVGASHAENGRTFADEADMPTLARRAALVLTGLPPEPEWVEALLADNSEDGYTRFIDQLLDSPRYGEHQARYWLDAVRYGDTHGLHLDNRRGIYPYRDWVVQAFNRNQPLDEFILWQLAGDLLPNPTLEQLVATGYVRMNPTTAEGGAIPDEFQAKNNFDRVETLGTVFLGMTLTCARCHSHKYDPVSQDEYYQLLAFFNSTAESPMDGNQYEYGPVIKAPADGPAWAAWHSLLDKERQILARIEKQLAQDDSDGTKKAATQWEQTAVKDRLALLADADFPVDQATREAADALRAQQSELQKSFATTLVARDLPKPRETRLLRRGEYNLPIGDPLAPDTIRIMGGFPEKAPRNRLGLAQWLTGRDHPLVARVLINRIWQRVFGYGLVRTPEDFGLQGQQPTNPELLDWLAVELHDSGWNLKHMLRMMVTSRTFRQSSARREGLEDPENLWLARGPSHRLDAEVIRDIGLWASGLLDPHMGGEGVKPYQPKGLWAALMHPASNTKLYVQDQGVKLYRRSLYVYWKRTSPHPMMTLFDAPSRESSCVRRSRTNTSLQSLGLLNETQRVEMSRRLAERLLKERDSEEDRIARLFQLLASRHPNAREKDACKKLLSAMHDRYTQREDDAKTLAAIGEAKRDESLNIAELAAWTQLAATVLASDMAILLY